jgi:hypothetical protein
MVIKNIIKYQKRVYGKETKENIKSGNDCVNALIPKTFHTHISHHILHKEDH